MRRAPLALSALVIAAGSLVPGSAAVLPPDTIWFCPGPGTVDFVELFERPHEWARARAYFQVFKFYQYHGVMPADPIVGPNSFDALARAGAFRQLMKWHKKIAIEVASVKEFYCTPDASGMDLSIQRTLDSVRGVRSAGGGVSYLAMDEPFVSGRSRACGGPALEPTADRVALYMSAVQRAEPGIQIGLIEAYPFSGASAIETMLQLLSARGTPPVFLHMDVDWHLLNSPEIFARDMKRLQAFSASMQMKFGIIVTGYDGDADALYAVDAEALGTMMQRTFERWESMPDHIVFQSWVESKTGLRITPNNLPESQENTHTRLLSDIFLQLWKAAGRAVER